VTSIREAGDLDGTAAAAARRLGSEAAHPVPRTFSCGPFVGAGRATFKNTILLEDASPALVRLARGRRTADGQDRRSNAGARHCQYADHRHQPKDALLSGL